MTKAGDKLIAAAHEAADFAKMQLDACMLRSMAVSFRLDQNFSFNPIDMADLLDRQADKLDAAMPGHLHEVLPNGGKSQ